jgi:hypothetical protein
VSIGNSFIELFYLIFLGEVGLSKRKAEHWKVFNVRILHPVQNTTHPFFERRLQSAATLGHTCRSRQAGHPGIAALLR